MFVTSYVPAGYRAAEEGGETMGQEVKVDEYEGSVWSSVLYSLAEPLCNTRPRQGRFVPVHCVKAGGVSELCCCGLPAPPIGWTSTSMNSSSPLLHFLYGYYDISGCSVVNYVVKLFIFKKTFTFLFLLFPSWCWLRLMRCRCTNNKTTKTSQTEQRQLTAPRVLPAVRLIISCFQH